jgi:hypothetical protein
MREKSNYRQTAPRRRVRRARAVALGEAPRTAPPPRQQRRDHVREQQVPEVVAIDGPKRMTVNARGHVGARTKVTPARARGPRRRCPGQTARHHVGHPRLTAPQPTPPGAPRVHGQRCRVLPHLVVQHLATLATLASIRHGPRCARRATSPQHALLSASPSTSGQPMGHPARTRHARSASWASTPSPSTSRSRPDSSPRAARRSCAVACS